MTEAKNAERLVPLGDNRMWRLLLARLHPDAGGDHDLFAFASAIRDEVSGGTATRNNTGEDTRPSAAPFLKTWHDAMGHWSSTNRDALKGFWAD